MKLLCDGLDQSRRRNHSDLYRVRTDVRKYAVDLLFQEFRCYLENPWTPVVFWAVSAVIALIPYTPFAIIVFKSAWMPAPPLESLPAIVNAVFIIKLLSGINNFY